MRKPLLIVGIVIGFISLALAVYFYGWKLAVILILFGWGMNVESEARSL